MYRLVCPEEIVLDENGVQSCSSTTGWILQEVPNHFEVSQLDANELAAYFAAGYGVFFAYWVLHFPLLHVVNTVIDLINRMNGRFNDD